MTSSTHTATYLERGDRPDVQTDKWGVTIRVSDAATLRWISGKNEGALAWLEDAAAQLRQAFTTADLAEAVPGDVIRFGRPGCNLSPWYEIATIERESLFGDHPDEYSVTLAGYGSLIIPNDWVVEVKQ
jgi:hypothetical protein